MSKCVARGRFSTLSLALALAGLVALSAPGRAEDAKQDDAAREAAKDAFATRLFAGPTSKPKNYACFVRVYDADHLARHKLQKVATMKLLVTAEKPQEKSEDGDKMTYSFNLGVKFRNRATAFESGGYCGKNDLTEDGNPGGQLHLGCGVDCDGGGIGIAMTNNDKSTKVTLERVRIWQKNNDDEDKTDSLVAGADDGEFRLDRVKLEECAPLINDKKERAAMLRMSRIK